MPEAYTAKQLQKDVIDLACFLALIEDSEKRHEAANCLSRIVNAKSEPPSLDKSEAEAILRGLLSPILALVEADPHQFSSRPCSTCRTVSALLGSAFGCNKRIITRG